MEDTPLHLPFLIHLPITTHDQPRISGGLAAADMHALRCPLLEANASTTGAVHKFLKNIGHETQAHVDAVAITSDDQVATLLNLGARRVFVPAEKHGQFGQFGPRVLPSVADPKLLAGAASEHGLLVKAVDPDRCDPVKLAETCRLAKIRNLFFKPAECADLGRFIELARQCDAVPILPSNRLRMRAAEEDQEKEAARDAETGCRSVTRILWSYLQSDRPDGLVPTVVCNESGVALGLAYSSEDSLGEALRTHAGVYFSRKRGIWVKGLTSGDTQELVRIAVDCDRDTLKFVVRQKGRFCHLDRAGCFGNLGGLSGLERKLRERKECPVPDSYTTRLLTNHTLLRAKIMEEADELCNAILPDEVAAEAADVIYFALTKVVWAGASLADVEGSLEAKSLKVTRRKGDPKPEWASHVGLEVAGPEPSQARPAMQEPGEVIPNRRMRMHHIDTARASPAEVREALLRPSQDTHQTIMGLVGPIIDKVRDGGDQALLKLTRHFDRVPGLKSSVLRAPFPASLMALDPETKRAIDVSFDNIRAFHEAQKPDELNQIRVETMPGVVCGRFARPIDRVGLYVPGGRAVLPSTALMLGVPAMVAGCGRIVIATPPRTEGTASAEIVYIAHRVGAECIVLAGGAQAIAALAYGTKTVPKVDKILGPGSQFVAAAKMVVSCDAKACVAVDMPAGPSEVLVVADAAANPVFVAADLLSQAEHGVDSQVVLVTVGLSDDQVKAIEDELCRQGEALPRLDEVLSSIASSVLIRARDLAEAMQMSNDYAPEHLILQIANPEAAVALVTNAGSVFIGPWSPESVGDYSAGVNHSLPTYGYARQYSGVNVGSFMKHITSSHLTAEGLRNISGTVMQLAKVEKLEGHRRAVEVRLTEMEKGGGGADGDGGEGRENGEGGEDGV